MSHELRTPLNGILGYAQLLSRSEELSPSSLRSVEAIEHCGDHLLMLISEILDLAKIEAGRLELENSTFELHEFLASVADIARLGATQAGLIFSHETRSAMAAFSDRRTATSYGRSCLICSAMPLNLRNAAPYRSA